MKRQRETGFTLIELMIVIAIIAVVAAIALPNLLSSRLNANEAAAIATLRAVVSAQMQFQSGGHADVDRDGIGEYGTFGELSGGVGVRGGVVITTPVLSSAFRSINASGEMARHGYQYRIYLPNALGVGVGEIAGGGVGAGVDPDLAETTWCCYAWPTDYEQSGMRTFYVNQVSDLLSTSNPAYSGPGAPIPPGAAARAPGNASSITGLLATGATGRDGSFWKTVQN